MVIKHMLADLRWRTVWIGVKTFLGTCWSFDLMDLHAVKEVLSDWPGVSFIKQCIGSILKVYMCAKAENDMHKKKQNYKTVHTSQFTWKCVHVNQPDIQPSTCPYIVINGQSQSIYEYWSTCVSLSWDAWPISVKSQHICPLAHYLHSGSCRGRTATAMNWLLLFHFPIFGRLELCV